MERYKYRLWDALRQKRDISSKGKESATKWFIHLCVDFYVPPTLPVMEKYQGAI